MSAPKTSRRAVPRTKRKPITTADVQAHLFILLCKKYKLPLPGMEVVFAAPRRWRVDFLWNERPYRAVALEIEGGAFLPGGGRHNRGASFVAEMEKYNELAARGFLLVRVTPKQLFTLNTIQFVARALGLPEPR